MGITFSSFRGLFFVSPILLLAIFGLWAWFRMRIMRTEWAVCTWATISFLLFNGSSAMWQGGYSIGPRYLVPMLPFLVTGLGAFAAKYGHTLWARISTIILTILSFLVVWIESIEVKLFLTGHQAHYLIIQFPKNFG